MQLVFDHLAIAATTREEGREWSEQTFGIPFPNGGEHPRMGTHNLLTACSDTAFIEIIAIDDDAVEPSRPRWFGLDEIATKVRLANRPSLEGWAVGTPDIQASLMAAKTAGADLGEPVEMTRGDLTWLISIREDGELPEFGCLPFLIEWPHNKDASIPHPASRMTDIGLRMESLSLRHPDPEKNQTILVALGASHLATCRTSEPGEAGPAAVLAYPVGKSIEIARG